MKKITTVANNRYYLFLDNDNNFGLNFNSTDPLPWYKLGNWDSFKKEVDAAIAQHQVSIQEQQLEQLKLVPMELLERAIKERNKT